MTPQQRRRYIATARELALELRFAAKSFEELSLRELAPADLWPAMQLDPALVARFGEFLERLWFDGIRTRFFSDFDASKLIVPIAAEIADRLDTLVEELEAQDAADGKESAGLAPAELELRIQN
jgi:hypothetical protein